jgi:hypothetical protein
VSPLEKTAASVCGSHASLVGLQVSMVWFEIRSGMWVGRCLCSLTLSTQNVRNCVVSIGTGGTSLRSRHESPMRPPSKYLGELREDFWELSWGVEETFWT